MNPKSNPEIEPEIRIMCSGFEFGFASGGELK